MKFTTEILGKLGARIGHFSLERNESLPTVVSTPFCLLYTKTGSVPHLTHDVREMLTDKSIPVHFTLNTLVTSCEALKEYGKGIGSFVGLENHVSYMSLQDPAVKVPSGYNTKDTTSVWASTGRVQIDVPKFMEIQEAFKPDWYQALCDSDTNYSTTRKRVRKGVDRSLKHLDECICLHSKSKTLQNSSLFGSIQGGYDIQERTRSAKETALRPVAGFIIDGFTNYGPEPDDLNFEEIVKILTEILKHLPVEKPRIMHGVWTPVQILKLVELGIDIFDMTFPYVAAEEGIALTFNFNFKNVTSDEIKTSNDEINVSRFGINLNEKQYFDDFSSLLTDCTCYTCRQFTRSYIHHLMATSEMLAYVLLMMHNIHHYLRFFDTIHEALRCNKLESLMPAVTKINN